MSEKTFGDRIKIQRDKLNWDQQYLAKKIGRKQQTISRWELNESTPKTNDILRLVELFSVDKDKWLIYSGRNIPSTIDNSRDPYLPFEELLPEKFELFCKYLVKAKYPSSDVHLYGKQGHTQLGIDIVADSGNKVFAYQCKRHKQFGKKRVRDVINKTTFNADHYYLLLSRTASPEARNEILKKPNWTLWDQVDLSEEVRRLRDFGEQVRLVNIFFPHKLKSFLGVNELAPWSSTEEFFASLQNKSLLFTHAWSFVGRKLELDKLKELVNNNEEKVAVIIGSGGIGKSRFLKAWSDSVESSTNVKFLANNTEVKLENFSQLLDESVLVIDDAHERDDLYFIVDWICKNRTKTKIVISSRPYAETEIKDCLSRSGVSYEVNKFIRLKSLKKQETISLSKEVISESSGNVDKITLERIAQLTKDCPLATVVGSKLVATKKILPDLLNNETKFTDELFTKFKDILSGQITGSSSKEIKNLLDFISIIQPFNLNSENFKESSSKILDRQFYQIIKDIRSLETAGVLINRNNQLRIVPDLLADQIRLDASYNKLSQQPSEFVDAIYDVVSDELAVNLVLNISKLDWRLSVEKIQSSLLDSIWNKIIQDLKGNSNSLRVRILKNLKDAAYYQPQRFISIAKFIISNPNFRSDEESVSGMFRFTHQDVLNELPGILRRVCYNLDYFNEVVDLIWEISKGDSRKTNQYPDHGLRVLEDIAQYDLFQLTRKPIIVNNLMLDAIKRWSLDTNLENYVHSPLDILDELLDKDSTTDEYQGGKIIFHSFPIHYENTKELRENALSIVVNYANSSKIELKLRAIKSLKHALSEPIGLYNRKVDKKEKKRWLDFQLKVLKIIYDLSQRNDNPIFLSELKEIVVWHARHSHDEEIKKKAREIFKKISILFEVKLVQSLSQNFDRDWFLDEQKYDYITLEKMSYDFRQKVAGEFLKKYPEYINGLDYLKKLLSSMEKYLDNFPFPLVFFIEISKKDEDYTLNICNEIINNKHKEFYRYIEYLLQGLLEKGYKKIQSLLEKSLEIHNQEMYVAVAAYYWRGKWVENSSDYDLDIKKLKILLSSDYKRAKSLAIGGLGRLCKKKPRLVIEILLSVNLDNDVHLASELLSQIDEKHGVNPKSLSKNDFKNLLKKLTEVNKIDEYHIEEFLNYSFTVVPKSVIKLLLDRIELSKTEAISSDYQALSYSSRKYFSNLSENHNYREILREVRDKIFKDDWQNTFWIPMLYKSISNNFDDIALDVLLELIPRGNKDINLGVKEKLLGIAEIIKKAPDNFVFSNQPFVLKMLLAADNFDDATYKKIRNSLAHSVIFRSKHGTTGKPMSEDVDLKNKSEEMLKQLSQSIKDEKEKKLLSELYFSLLKHANYEIKGQLKIDEELYQLV